MVKLILITNGNDEVREAVEQIISEVKPFEFDLAREEIYAEGHKVYTDKLEMSSDEIGDIFIKIAGDSKLKEDSFKMAAFVLNDEEPTAFSKFEYGSLETKVEIKVELNVFAIGVWDKIN
ncbi:MAG: hypothetical protein ACRCX8_12550 [Sarcina sp.]